MINYYGVTQQGTYHIEHDIVCQDAHFCKVVNDHYAVAAVADGLGSEKYSDVASKIASEKAVTYCVENINETDSEEAILDTIKNSFSIALAEIFKVADEAKQDRDQYDTTLALVVYINQTVYFGNSGDSGIVVLNKNGTYEAITEQQRDENNYVFPLCFGEEKWAFGKKENVASVLLATDGLFETLFPFLLQNEQVKIYVSLAHYLMNEECLNFQKEGSEAVRKKMEAFISSISGKQVNDDKTLLVLLNSEVVAEKMPDEYYAAPDWVALKKKHDEAFRRAAYPHLYQSDEGEETVVEKTNMASSENQDNEEVKDDPDKAEVDETTDVGDTTADSQNAVESNNCDATQNDDKTENDVEDNNEQKTDSVKTEERSFFSNMKRKASSLLKRKE